MIGEIVLLDTPDHAFNVLNRDQSTSIFNPEKWNDDSLVENLGFFCWLF
jgi:hypothetical protein